MSTTSFLGKNNEYNYTCMQTQETPRQDRDSKGVSSAFLKWVAIVAMTCNHAAYIFYPHLPFEARMVLVAAGGLTFPIMAFLLVEGYLHTSNLKRYAARLAIFAAIAEVPFWLFLGHEGNVLITLLGGLVVLWVFDNVENDWLRTLCILAVVFATWPCDWGGTGPVIMLLFYRLRTRRWGIAATVALPIALGVSAVLPRFLQGLAKGSLANLPFLMYYLVGNVAAIPLLMAYNGQRGAHPMKWFFYIYYPAHIAILGIVHLLVFGSMPHLMVG